uniref:ADF-H domain-containing protein n=1 Tax=Chromera velia CCMP2878 TaxID=1169474 RepID=A0A0G4HXJ5_9ALVE|mmetsp:Transcript_36650/g.72072  ORF Transcript_36650/g.72072 Transcript_36650/m.72072 type:complete len:362 (+) Transcript_36650:337-1422(+)|eukprot:Cvel_33130.t1-p1 / transcript=Cvel_33130.t1 / gene=Cvel_33130 / organism=Chromera_velia_CCMP2878 / gene_product=Twinfilin-2-A, putative / transcript_product=Twinfilin-2-A, putative / location=Cvel_scaffold5305:941-2023(-) / protein_length=361 / sequence_SO=supercontig / SO=protein_coding / is_pseudo=false
MQQNFAMDKALRHELNASKTAENNIRAIKVLIQKETLMAEGVMESGSSLETDFEGCQSFLDPDAPCYVLLRVDGSGSTPQWVLVAWVPDKAPPKLKLLYAAARDCLRGQLGNAFFVRDFFVSEKKDMNYHTWKDSLRVNGDDWQAAALSPEESLVREEQCATRNESVQQLCIPQMPVAFHQNLLEQVKAFKNKEFPTLMMRLDDKTQTFTGNKMSAQTPSELARRLDVNEPRYYMLRQRDKACLVMSSLEGSTLPAKFLYAACKNSLVAFLKSQGVNIYKTVDIRKAEDLTDAAIQDEALPPLSVGQVFSHAVPRPPVSSGASGEDRDRARSAGQRSAVAAKAAAAGDWEALGLGGDVEFL